MKLTDRYLMKSILGPFLFGIVAFVLLLVSGNTLFKLTELMSQLGLGLGTAAELFALWLPGFVVLTFPLATLVAILIVFGRMSGESELVAMFAGGVSFRRMIVPLVAFGFFVSLATAALNEFVVPAAESRAFTIVKDATLKAGKEYDQSVLQKETSHGQVVRLVYADKLDLRDQSMTNVVITWFKDGKPELMTTAESAHWKGTVWEMRNGKNIFLNRPQRIEMQFPQMDTQFTVSPKQLVAETRKPAQMTYEELKTYIGYTAQQGKAIASLELALHHKLSIPFASLVFVLIAPPLGLRSHRGSGSIGMGLAILIGFGYYVIWNYLAIVAQQGSLAPLWAAWLPNLVTAAVGLVLIARVRR